MAIENGANKVPLLKSTSESAVAYTFVKAGAADNTVAVATAGARILGIYADTIGTGFTSIAVAVGGIFKVKTGGIVTRGGILKSDSSGYAVTADTTKDEYGAVALESGASGDIISVLITPGQIANI